MLRKKGGSDTVEGRRAVNKIPDNKPRQKNTKQYPEH